MASTVCSWRAWAAGAGAEGAEPVQDRRAERGDDVAVAGPAERGLRQFPALFRGHRAGPLAQPAGRVARNHRRTVPPSPVTVSRTRWSEGPGRAARHRSAASPPGRRLLRVGDPDVDTTARPRGDHLAAGTAADQPHVHRGPPLRRAESGDPRDGLRRRGDGARPRERAQPTVETSTAARPQLISARRTLSIANSQCPRARPRRAPGAVRTASPRSPRTRREAVFRACCRVWSWCRRSSPSALLRRRRE